MIKTDEELSKAIKYLNKRAMSCNNTTGEQPSREVVKLLRDENMSVEEFNENVVSKLDFENKYKLSSALRQARYNKENPMKSLKLHRDVATRFDELRENKSINAFVSELLDLFESKML